MRNARRQPKPKQMSREYLRCAQCGPVPTLARRQQMELSCSIIGRGTEVRCCLQTLWDNCAGLIARLASSVALSDRSGVASATTAEATLFSANFAWETLSRTDDSLGIRTLRSAVRQPVNNSLRVPPGEPLDDSPLPNCPTRDVVLTKRQAAHRASLGLGDGTPAVRGLSIRHGLDRESRRSHERSSVGFALPLPLLSAPC